MNELKYHRVNLNDLYAIVTDILMKPSHETAMLNLWNEFGTVQHKVLSIIAALSSTNQRGVEISEIASTFQELGEMIPLDEVSTICESLADAELLEKTTSPAEQSEPYQITIPLYQMWLKQNKPPRTVFGQRSIESPSYQ